MPVLRVSMIGNFKYIPDYEQSEHCVLQGQLPFMKQDWGSAGLEGESRVAL